MSRSPNLRSIRRRLQREDARKAQMFAQSSLLASLPNDHQMPVINSKPRMGRPPSNGGSSFRFTPIEVSEMEAILQANNCIVPTHEILDALAQRFSSSIERVGKVEVSNKQVCNWFQNRRYAIRAKAAWASTPGTVHIPPELRDDPLIVKVAPQVSYCYPPQHQASHPQAPELLQPALSMRGLPQAPQSLPAPSVHIPPMPQDDPSVVKVAHQVSKSIPPQHQASHPQAPKLQPALSTSGRSLPQAPQPLPAPSATQGAGMNASENSQMEFEAKSARDGAWYDVACFLSYRALDRGYPEALVRFSGFGQEEDEWINIPGHVRQRSLPCESSECVAVLPGDLILCFQEGKEQALYFDARVLDAQRRRHDVRGCRCRFLVQYDHDQSEEIVPLRKICRRPETDHRLQQLNLITQKARLNTQAANTLKVDVPIGTTKQQSKPEKQSEAGYMTTAAAAIQTSIPAINES